MLKELNSIAGGLLGLEGYPMKPLWSNEASRHEADADACLPVRTPVDGAAMNDGRSPGHHALSC